ncbi:MAG: carboxypeptidase-like regulatory domain-containing protein [Saprospiraceae bacterium]
MQRLLYFLLFTISMQLANAQGTIFQIRGRVLDENGEALPGTTLQTTDRQAVTDAAGRFNLDIPSKTGWLTVRCIGYFPQRIALDTLRFSGQIARLDIFLKSNAVNLPEIAISSKPMESVFQEDFRSNLLDYDFAGEDLLLLVQLGKKYFLQLTTDNGRLLTELQLPEPADLLHRSCTGDLHVVGEHHAREITLAGNRIDTFPRYTTDLFYKLVKPCVLEQNGYYFYQKTGAYRQSVQYLYYDPDRKQHLLAIIRNEIIEAQLRRRHMEILAAYMLTLSDLDRDDILDGYSPLTDPEKVLRPENLTRMAETNGLVANIGFFSTLAEDSVYAPLIKVGSRIYLLDHVNDKMLRIAMPPRHDQTAPLTYHRSAGWRKQVLVDAALERVYGRFSAKDGALVLKELDLETGGARKTYTPAIAPYLSNNFKMRNGMLYFIGQPNVNIPNRRLYKLNLFTFAE